MFVKPTRSALVRTRLDADAIREALVELTSAQEPAGMEGLIAHGYFLDGQLEDREFRFNYHYNAQKNPQTYGVRGLIQDSPEWRVIRLTIKAQAPWLSAVELGILAVALAVMAYGNYKGPGFVIATLAVVVAIYGFANLVYIPDKVRNRVADAVARRVRGAVQQHREWVVPEKED
jgi:hypothetical protein